MKIKNILNALIISSIVSFSTLSFAEMKTPDPIRFTITIELKDKDKAKEWLQHGLTPNFEGDKIGTGLMIGAWNGDIEMMELFLSHGADINFINKNGEQALLHAAYKGQKKSVEWLLEHGAKINRDGEKQWSALHYAAFSGHEDIVDLLIKKGADINARTTNGSSSLMMAVYEGQENIVNKLTALGVNKAIKNDWGDGALEWAVKYDRLSIAKKVAPTKEEYIETISRPKSSWGKVFRSEKSPAELENLMYEEMILNYHSKDTKEVKNRIAQYQKRMISNAFEKAKSIAREKEELESTVVISSNNIKDSKNVKKPIFELE